MIEDLLTLHPSYNSVCIKSSTPKPIIRQNRRYRPSAFYLLTYFLHLDRKNLVRQVEVGGLVCHVDLFAIRPQSLPSLRVAGPSEGSSSAASSSSPPNSANFSQMVTPIPPPEDAKVTDSLFGTTFSVASQIKGLDGNEVIFYVFSVSLQFGFSPTFL